MISLDYSIGSNQFEKIEDSIASFFSFLQLRSTGGLGRIFFSTGNLLFILYIRFFVMGNSLPDFASADNPAASEPEMLTRFLTFLYLPLYNMWLLVLPVSLSYDYSIYTVPLVDGFLRKEVLLSCVFYTALLVTPLLILRYFRRYGVVDYDLDSRGDYCLNHNKKSVIYHKPKDVSTLSTPINNSVVDRVFISESLIQFVFSVVLLVLPFLPASNLFFYVGFIVAERILYIPSIGFSLLVLTGLSYFKRSFRRGNNKDGHNSEQRMRKILCFVLVLFAAKTFHRNFAWQNEEALYRSGVSTSPAKCKCFVSKETVVT